MYVITDRTILFIPQQRGGFTPIVPVACPNPENPGILPDVNAGAGAGSFSMTSPVKWLKPENPAALTFPTNLSSLRADSTMICMEKFLSEFNSKTAIKI
jgi:hypothetical protein